MDMQLNEEPMDGEDPRGVAPGMAPRPPVVRDPRIAENARRQQEERRRRAGMGPMSGINPMQGLAGPADQARMLQGMINQTTGAVGREMDARRSSFREARRLAHEREMLLLRLQAERESRDY